MFAVEWNKALRANETGIQLLEEIEQQVIQELKAADKRVLSALASLNGKQRRNDAFDIESALGTLSESSSNKDIDGISTSLKAENDSLEVDVIHWTSLHYEAAASEISNLPRSDFLTVVNMKDLSGQTLLHLAVGMDDITLLSSLLEASASLDNKRTDGKTPLHCAVLNARFDSVRMLIEAGANVNATDFWKQTPLHLAAWFGDRETIQYLLQSANPLAADLEGRTPLHIVERLLYLGLDVNAVDVDGQTVLHKAAQGPRDFEGETDHELIVQALIHHGGRINARDSQGRTPLFIAARHMHWPALRQFLRIPNEYMEQDLALAIRERLQDQDETPTRSAVQVEIQALVNRARATHEDERKQIRATDGQSRIPASGEDSDDEHDGDDRGENWDL